MNKSCIQIVLLASVVGALVAACAFAPTATHTVAVPAVAQGRDVLELAIEAARSAGLPPVTRLDKVNGLVEFGAFGFDAIGYTAQVRQRSDGQLDVTVKRGSVYVPLGVDEKAKEFVAALEARLRQPR